MANYTREELQEIADQTQADLDAREPGKWSVMVVGRNIQITMINVEVP